MDDRKQVKKDIKICKKKLKKSNIAVRGFMRGQNYRKGSYSKLQHTKIWTNAKQTILEYHSLKKIPMICPYCNLEVKNNPILHHIRYNWKQLFFIGNIRFFHYNCHEKFHNEIASYRKGKWKRAIKKTR